MIQLVYFCLPPTSTSVYGVEQGDAGPGAYMWVAWLWLKLLRKYDGCRQGGSVTDGSFDNAENLENYGISSVQSLTFHFIFSSFCHSLFLSHAQADKQISIH